MRVAILIPSYNQLPWQESFLQRLQASCFRLKQNQFSPVVVFVDDGSVREECRLNHHLENLSRLGADEVLTTKHNVNRGQGAALMTALTIARSAEVGAQYFVTLDADGQHDPLELFKLLDCLRTNDLNIVFGNRFRGDKNVIKKIPLLRRLILRAGSLFERFLTGLALSDAHNGFRVFDLKTARLLDIQQDRMAHATEIKQQVARRRLKYGEAPINIQYTEESIKQGQSNMNAINILRELFQGWMFQ